MIDSLLSTQVDLHYNEIHVRCVCSDVLYTARCVCSVLTDDGKRVVKRNKSCKRGLFLVWCNCCLTLREIISLTKSYATHDDHEIHASSGRKKGFRKDFDRSFCSSKIRPDDAYPSDITNIKCQKLLDMRGDKKSKMTVKQRYHRQHFTCGWHTAKWTCETEWLSDWTIIFFFWVTVTKYN